VDTIHRKYLDFLIPSFSQVIPARTGHACLALKLKGRQLAAFSSGKIIYPRFHYEINNAGIWTCAMVF